MFMPVEQLRGKNCMLFLFVLLLFMLKNRIIIVPPYRQTEILSFLPSNMVLFAKIERLGRLHGLLAVSKRGQEALFYLVQNKGMS
jgi:hypothetical protein